jgi:hypothetical protein
LQPLIEDKDLLEILDDIGVAYMSCTHHPLTHFEYGATDDPRDINKRFACNPTTGPVKV